jgi:hypothetical protein
MAGKTAQMVVGRADSVGIHHSVGIRNAGGAVIVAFLAVFPPSSAGSPHSARVAFISVIPCTTYAIFPAFTVNTPNASLTVRIHPALVDIRSTRKLYVRRSRGSCDHGRDRNWSAIFR